MSADLHHLKSINLAQYLLLILPHALNFLEIRRLSACRLRILKKDLS